jgi:hypothetical protein
MVGWPSTRKTPISSAFSTLIPNRPSLPMSPTPLEILKQGLRSFSQKIKQRKDELEAKLKQCEALSPADENWLDSEANVVDEQQILEQLESASDYERGLACLDDKGTAIVKKLREWAGELPVKLVGKK